METLLLFFALPVAVIIISIALQKIFKNPLLVASIIFAIFLVVTFIVTDTVTFLIATIIYTILSFITAILTKIICRILRNLEDDDNNNGNNNDNNCNNNNTLGSDLNTATKSINDNITYRTNGYPYSNEMENYYRCYRRK